MAQHDYNLENQTGFQFRGDLNNALAAIATNNSGATAPTPAYPHQWWFDTANDLLKIRNELNDAWVVVAKKVGNNYFVYSASGTAELPGITFTGNVNTGFFSPASGVLGISSNGQERVRINSSGNIGIGGVQTPTERLDVSGNMKLTGSVNANSLIVGGTSVIDSTRKLENVTGLKTVNGQSILGSGDIAVSAGDSNLREVYSGVVPYGNLRSRTYRFEIKYGAGQNSAREFVSPDSFVVVTSLNDSYTVPQFALIDSEYSVTKHVLLSHFSLNSYLYVTLNVSNSIYPNNVNMKIYVQNSTSVTALVYSVVEYTNRAYGSNCKAWVNFNGVNATILQSRNVFSINKFGTGDYRLNFTDLLTDSTYVALATVGTNDPDGQNYPITAFVSRKALDKTIGSVRIICANINSNLVDVNELYVAIFY